MSDPIENDDATVETEEAAPGSRVEQLEREGDIAADYLEELLDIADLDGDLDMDVDGDRDRPVSVRRVGEHDRLTGVDLRRALGVARQRDRDAPAPEAERRGVRRRQDEPRARGHLDRAIGSQRNFVGQDLLDHDRGRRVTRAEIRGIDRRKTSVRRGQQRSVRQLDRRGAATRHRRAAEQTVDATETPSVHARRLAGVRVDDHADELERDEPGAHQHSRSRRRR